MSIDSNAPANGNLFRLDLPHGSQRTLRCSPRIMVYALCKRLGDVVISSALLALALPLLLLGCVLIKLTSRGPVFYSQVRLGRSGKPFHIYKLRTMIADSEKQTGPTWSQPGDPRITRVGRLLRRTHIDELPQLWNVIRGDMSLVGPRPERPEFVHKLEQVIPRYRERLAVRPGVTGLAQVQLPPDSDLHSVRRKLAYDIFYMQNLSPWMDFRLFLGTALHVVGISYCVIRQFFRLPKYKTVWANYGGSKTRAKLAAQAQVT